MSSNSLSRSPALRATGFALAIAIFSSVWLVVMTATGWYRDPDRMEIAIAVPIVEVILLVVACWQARRDGWTISRRLFLCVAITLLAAVLSAGFAYAYTKSQENYFTHVQQAHADGLRRMGKTDAEIATMLATHPIGTPKGFALNRFRNTIAFGVIGTLVGLLVTLRRRSGTVDATVGP